MEDTLRILPGGPLRVRSVPSSGRNAYIEHDVQQRQLHRLAKPLAFIPWASKVQ